MSEVIKNENTTEEVVETKSYTQAELDEYVNGRVDELLPKKIARERRKLEREYKDRMSKYEEAELVLNAGLGTEDITEATGQLREFYEEKGIDIPEYQNAGGIYSEEDLKVLAKAEAQKLIDYGYDDVVDEVDRLAEIGVDNMSARDREYFVNLCEYRKDYEEQKELAEIGVTADALKNADYVEFAKQLNPNLSAKEKYQLYTKYNPKNNIEQIGSVKSYNNGETGVKEFYSYEEAKRFTKEDYDKTPGLLEAVEKSMYKWGKK